MTTTPDQLTDRELVATLDEWMAAIVANDADRIGAFMAEEWVMVSENGIATAERFLALVRSGELTHSAMCRVGDARVRHHGDLALLTTRATNTAHYLGTRIDADEWTTDVFTHVDGRWLCLLTQITAAKTA
ncbi:nuclear transport factor 2 family protein [Nocardia neocaledoniensis]|uniref:nuclear transport factor 2 family protein n=1 Tax=Nocardia neocaledoniensis TaxID=236511 RepID=UPI00245546E4|nr:nuclear transport factor 2 family protein [Nocardia neocaledoniensis]